MSVSKGEVYRVGTGYALLDTHLEGKKVVVLENAWSMDDAAKVRCRCCDGTFLAPVSHLSGPVGRQRLNDDANTPRPRREASTPLRPVTGYVSSGPSAIKLMAVLTVFALGVGALSLVGLPATWIASAALEINSVAGGVAAWAYVGMLAAGCVLAVVWMARGGHRRNVPRALKVVGVFTAASAAAGCALGVYLLSTGREASALQGLSAGAVVAIATVVTFKRTRAR